ncbi:MAG TPA: GNAT family N-acetyltransferase [Candidatus Acidoferrum sp.]|nr:GNAT family N-acetyltransferase [Candidatus Acidoferrum sp.]
MTLRRATPDDLDALVRLLGILFEQEVEFSPDAVVQRRGLELILAQPDSGFILVAERDATVVGTITVQYSISTVLGARVGFLEDVVVLPSLRNDGIGSQLLQAACEEAQRQGCQRLTLLTDGDNSKAQRFYQRHGFKRSSMVPFRRFFR